MTDRPSRSSRPPSSSAVIYDQPIDVNAKNDSHALMLRMVELGSRVLEYGCSTGRMTKIMQDMGCTVTGIEIDAEAAKLARRYAREVHIVDLDSERVSQRLASQTFDAVIFGDVLEHLRDSTAALKDALKLLTAEGRVIISVPNMAHADVRLSLLEGQVSYGDWGLLDRTHLRWFTRDSLEQLLAAAGLEIVDLQRTTRPIGETEIAYNRGAVPKALTTWLAQQPEVTTYQFIAHARRRRGAVTASAATAHLVDWASLQTRLA